MKGACQGIYGYPLGVLLMRSILHITAAPLLMLSLVGSTWAGFGACDSCGEGSFSAIYHACGTAGAVPAQEQPACHGGASEQMTAATACGAAAHAASCGGCSDICQPRYSPSSTRGALAAHPAASVELAKVVVATIACHRGLSQSPAGQGVLRLDRLLESKRLPLMLSLFHVHSLLLN